MVPDFEHPLLIYLSRNCCAASSAWLTQDWPSWRPQGLTLKRLSEHALNHYCKQSKTATITAAARLKAYFCLVCGTSLQHNDQRYIVQ
jgi:hypothetical protein